MCRCLNTFTALCQALSSSSILSQHTASPGLASPSRGDPTPCSSLPRTFSLSVSILDYNGQDPWLFCSPLSIQENVWHKERSQTVTVNSWSDEWVNDRLNVAQMPKKSSKLRISAQNKNSTGGESALYVMPVPPAPISFRTRCWQSTSRSVPSWLWKGKQVLAPPQSSVRSLFIPACRNHGFLSAPAPRVRTRMPRE